MKALKVTGTILGIGVRWVIGLGLIIGHLVMSLIGILVCAICKG